MKTGVNYIIVADTETGGLPTPGVTEPFKDIALIEIAAVAIDCITLEIVDEFNKVLLPYKNNLTYDKKAEEVHGLTKEMIQSLGEDQGVIYSEFCNFLTKYSNKRHKAILCGHNFVGFDLPFFDNWFKFNEGNLSDYVLWTEDTQKLMYYSTLESPNYKLGTCCQSRGIELVEAHRALPDTIANAKLMISILETMRGANVVVKEEKIDRFRDKFQI